MVKRIFCILAFMAVLSGGLYAQQQSPFYVSGGFITDIGVGLISASFNEPGFLSESADMGIFSGGFGAFVSIGAMSQFGEFGTGFLDFSIGVYGGPLSLEIWDDFDVFILDGSFFAFDFSLIGGLYFRLGGFSLGPLVGIGYQSVVSAELEGLAFYQPGDLGNFRIMLGVGSDISITERVFFRTQLMGYYRFSSNYERNVVDELNRIPFFSATAHGGFGGSLRLGIGLRL